jgi:hypothetical protein
MKLTELLTKYNFHDSSITSVDYNTVMRQTIVIIDFCNWAQDDYIDNSDENIVLKLTFDNVSDISGEKPLFNVNEILDCELTENGRAIDFFTERTDIASRMKEYHTLRIFADGVTVNS